MVVPVANRRYVRRQTGATRHCGTDNLGMSRLMMAEDDDDDRRAKFALRTPREEIKLGGQVSRPAVNLSNWTPSNAPAA